MSIEAVQSILFPLVLLLFWRAPFGVAYRLPGIAAAAALGCWAIASLNIRGYLPDTFSAGLVQRERIVLATLEEDAEEKASRALLRRYNAIAQAYGLPKMEVMLRTFSDASLARDWARGRDDVRLLISGTPEWLRVHFSRVELELAGNVESINIPPAIAHAASAWGVAIDDRVRVVRIPELATAVVLALTPDSLTLPGEPSELSRHYLGWLAEAIGAPKSKPRRIGDASLPLGRLPQFEQLQLHAFREDALAQTYLMLGSWKSPDPIAVARLLSGTYQLADALAEVSAGSEELLAAFTTLNNAQRLLRRERQPELLSLIRNNAGVARVVLAKNEEDLVKAKRELIVAGTFTDHEGRPTAGAKIAMLNLTLLEEAGVL